MNKIACPFVLLAFLAAGCSNVERSRDLSNPAVPPAVTAVQVCSACHGIDGNSTSPNFPKLAGQQHEYFVNQMKEFRSHNRSDPAGFEYMWGITRHLTDQQIDGLASYYEKQAATASASGPADAGKNIFEKGVPEKGIPPCASCHGTDGHGNGQFPRLAGQHADYLVKQLNIFQRTDQRPSGPMMKTVAHELTPAHMDNVTRYIATLK